MESDSKQPARALQEKYSEELSPGRYAVKKLYELAVTLGGLLGGGLIGQSVGKVSSVASRVVFPISSEGKGINCGGVVGGMLGTVAAGLVLGYEHWCKEESSKLAVAEINRDIANKIGIEPTDKELVRENMQLRAMVEKKYAENERISAARTGRSASDIAAKSAASSHEQRVLQEQASADAAIARG